MKTFITRTITSIILLALLIGAFVYLSPLHLSILIAAIYFYAFIGEYLPLAKQSFTTSPKITILAGLALITTGITHVYWATTEDPSLLYTCIALAVLSDMGGYIFGNLFGKHLLAPTISPKKTWEGLAGSIVLTSVTIFAFLYFFVTVWGSHRVITSKMIYSSAFFGTIFALAATLGDLLFSYLKRTANVKDTGNILPGHGGILDRLDSIIGTTVCFMIFMLIGMLVLPLYVLHMLALSGYGVPR